MRAGLTVLFAGGGTGGHLYPAVAVAQELRRRRPDARIVFAGTRGKIEARVVPAEGFEFAPLWISGFRRRLRLETLLFPIKLVVSLVQAFLLIRRIAPQVVVGTGGYVCGPPLAVAVMLGVPTLLQEQNSYPGVTTRLLASHVDQVHITFAATRQHLRRADNVHLSGNPTRAAIGAMPRAAGAAAFGLRPELPTLLVVGGSLGASSINSAVLGHLDSLLATGVQLLWQTGSADADRVQEAVQRAAVRERVRVMPFIETMDAAYAACDLALCRAGATTLAELTRAGIPAVLVPYPYAAADHQTENARALVEAGAALMCTDAELEARLMPLLCELISQPTLRAAMAAQARALGRPDAAATLATAILHLAGATS